MAEINLKQARELAGISQTELDRRAGLPRGTTFDLETGRTLRPSHEVVVKVVRALHASGLKGIESEALFPVPDEGAVAS